MSEPIIIKLPRPLKHAAIIGRSSAAKGGSPVDATASAAENASLKGQAQARSTKADIDKLLEKDRNDLLLARLAMEAAAQQLRATEAQIALQVEKEAVGLALRIASQLLAQEIQASRYEVDPIVQAALGKITARHDIVVRLHPEDLARCQAAQAPRGEGAAEVRFVGDPTVKRAGCVVEMPEGILQADIESNLNAVAQTLGVAEPS